MTMKLSILASAALLASAAAFAPANRAARPSSLFAVSGDVSRAARGTYAAHGTGEIGSFDRAPPQAGRPIAAICGEDVREQWKTYAAHGTGEIGSFDRAPPQGGPSHPSVCGEDVRDARSTYAAHGTGEIGSDQRRAFVPNAFVAPKGQDEEGDWMT